MPYYNGASRAVGDPGFFSFLGKAIGTVGRVVGGALGLTAPAAPRQLPPPGAVTPPIAPPAGRTGGLQVQFPPFTAHPMVRISGQRFQPQAGVPPTPIGGIAPKGHHLNRSSYFLRDGTFVPEGTRWVPNRTRNPANPRALRRAISRAKAFDSLVKRNRKALRSLSRI